MAASGAPAGAAETGPAIALPDGPAAPDPTARALNWLLRSGIWILDPQHPHHGALYARYERMHGSPALVYAEATGYMLSLLAYVDRIRADIGLGANGELLQHAHAAAGWLLAWADAHGGLLPLGVDGDQPVREVYTFDQGVCAKGLLDLYVLRPDPRYLSCARALLQWIIDDAMNTDGSVKPLLDIASGRFREDPATWYKASGTFHAKIAMPLLSLSALTGDAKPRDAALRLCRWVTRQQRSDGAFPASVRTRAVNLHFHCYTVEGLLYAYGFERDQGLLGAAERGIAWALQRQRSDGTLPRWHGWGRFRGRAADVQAQATRLLAVQRTLRPDARLTAATEKARAGLLAMQCHSHDVREDGGFLEGDVSRYRVLSRPSPHLTSWAAMFALQALSLTATSSRSGDVTGRILF
jgi:uncharacterized protein YyaL (SSP411 family)